MEIYLKVRLDKSSRFGCVSIRLPLKNLTPCLDNVEAMDERGSRLVIMERSLVETPAQDSSLSIFIAATARR
ncbi:hypothetical protein LCGC14_1667120 [marine sediment metagenome]|uniref:Uncharacterized protein n=1 Tax=marine sediment metagenome TaxID=412755 RepID=A0A0F9IEZ3_9ZZZZ